MSHPVAKVIEIIGSSEQGWEGAAQAAIDEAKKDLTWDTRYRSCRYDCHCRP